MSDPTELPGMSLECSLAATVSGDRIEFSYDVRNPDDEPIELQFSDAQESDLVVEDTDGTEVWRWSAGRMFAQMLQQKGIPPGGTLTYDFEWEPPESGKYEATATLEATNAECDASVAFEV
jgi:hypothetical protein